MPLRPKRDRRTARNYSKNSRRWDFDGDYSRVTEFVRRWREFGGQAAGQAFVPCVLRWEKPSIRLERGATAGRQGVAQDSGGAPEALRQPCLRTAGVPRRATKCCSMRTPAHSWPGRHSPAGHLRQHATAVDKVNKGKSRVVNTRFAAMASHYLFDPDFCNVASGWEKGVVEKNVRTAAAESGRTLPKSVLAPLPNSTCGCWQSAALWQELRHPDSPNTPLPRCSSTNTPA